MQPRPVVNVEEFIGKIVGQRAPASEAGLQKTLNLALKTQNRGLCPKGVYRCNSHEEANEWMEKMLNRP